MEGVKEGVRIMKDGERDWRGMEGGEKTEQNGKWEKKSDNKRR
jgi:hypothetical protein